MATSTTIVFVPGAAHSPHCFDKVISKLEGTGYNIDRVFLASVSTTEVVTDTSLDVAVIRNSIERAVEAGQNVVVVSHSFGGVPTTEAITEDMSASARQKLGKQGGIINFVFCTSFIVPENQNLFIFDPPQAPAGAYKIVDGLAIPSDHSLLRSYLYSDMSEDDAEKAIDILIGQSPAVMDMQVTNAGWKYVPCTYIYCTLDTALPYDLQKKMVDEARAQGAVFRTETLEAAHSPFYTQPDGLALAIRRAAGEVL